MKHIVLSFDDSRVDTYDNAFPIIRGAGLNATVNVITDYVQHKDAYSFPSSKGPMSITQLREWEKHGFEIALHGHTHKNTVQDILENKAQLELMDINTDDIGFASPHSYIDDDNVIESGVYALKDKGIISYIRSGVQIRREGIIYSVLSMIERITRSKRLFFTLNKRNIISASSVLPRVLPSVAIKSYTTLRQIVYLISNIQDGDSVILMFHSIISPSQFGYGADCYYWSKDDFTGLCKYLSEDDNIQVLTTKEMIGLLDEDDRF